MSSRCWQTETRAEQKTQAVSQSTLFGGKTASEQQAVPQN